MPMVLQPESKFSVEVTAQDEIACRSPSGPEQRINVANLGSVYFVTTEGSPFASDWWLLNDADGELSQMATSYLLRSHATWFFQCANISQLLLYAVCRSSRVCHSDSRL